jgi:hypothetical protein
VEDGVRRTSGEARSVDDDGDDEEVKGDERQGESGTWAPTPTRPYPIWLKIDPPKRRLPPTPAHLSRPTWARLSRQVAAFLRSRLNNSASLRALVRVVRAEMLLAGATSAEIQVALRSAVSEHPELSTLDRTNVVTRRLASDELIDQMLGWLSDAEAAG